MDMTSIKESIDLILATAVFSENIVLIFSNDAVLHLEAPLNIDEQNDTHKMFNAFELYGISPIYADKSDCITRHLEAKNCIMDVQFITAREQQTLMDSAKKVTQLA